MYGILLLLALSEMKIIVNVLQTKYVYHYTVVWKHFALEILTINFGKYFFLLCYYKVFTANANRIESIESCHWYCNTYHIVSRAYRFNPTNAKVKTQITCSITLVTLH
jgi:hypothetical protein